jgi:hypothetical protein
MGVAVIGACRAGLLLQAYGRTALDLADCGNNSGREAAQRFCISSSKSERFHTHYFDNQVATLTLAM